MDEQVKKAIQRQLIRKAPSGFSSRVMNEVYRLSVVKPYQPIISRTAWWVIGALLLLFTAFLVFYPKEVKLRTDESALMQKLSQSVEALDFSWLNVFEGANLLVVAIVSLVIFLLLFFDTYFYKKIFRKS